MNQGQAKIPPWSAFKFRDYRLLWISSLLGGLTMQIRVITSGFWLYDVTGSGLQLGILGIIQLITEIPAILYGGVLADFLQRKKLISLTHMSNVIGTINPITIKNNNGKTIIKATILLRRWALARLFLRGIPSAVTKIVLSWDFSIKLGR